MYYLKLALFILLIFNFGYTIADNVGNDSPYTNIIPAVDSLLQKIHNENWQDQVCQMSMTELLLGVKENKLWSTWAWDSMQSPVGTAYGSRYQLGNYDQCLKPYWLHTHPELRTQYCLVQITFSNPAKKLQSFDPFDSAQAYYNMTSVYGRHLGLVVWGLCLPSKCNEESVVRISKLMYEDTHLPKGKVDIEVLSCQKAGDVQEFTYGFCRFFLIIVALFITAVLSTIYHIDNKENVVSKIAASFNMKNNWESLFTSYNDEIKTLNSIRSITTFGVVVFHTFAFGLIGGLMNSLDIDKALNTWVGYIFLHMDLGIDTYFVLSALLFTRTLLSMRNKDIIIMPIKRYIRLIGVFAVAIFFIADVVTYFSVCPFQVIFGEKEQTICYRTSWKQLIMLNNDMSEMCGIHTWYIPCDYQLSLVATLLVYIYSKNKNHGYIAYGMTFLAALLIPAYITYWYKLPVMLMAVIEDVTNYRENQFMDRMYIKSYARAGAYLIGMAMGYLIFKYDPAKYRNTISKKLSIFGLIIACIIIAVSLISGKIINDRHNDPVEAAIVSALDRPLWAIAICIVIAICEYGNISYLNNILSWNAFVPISRLSYGIYLSHPIIAFRNIIISRSPITFDILLLVVNSLGIFLLSVCISIVLWLLVEAPLSNLSGYILFPKKHKPQKQN